MVGAAASGACVQTATQLDPEHSRGSDHIGDIYPEGQVYTAAECPYQTSPAGMPEHSFFAEAFVSQEDTGQYEYPPPDDALDGPTTPYQNPSRTPHKPATYRQSIVEDVDATSDFASEHNMPPVTRHLATPCTHIRDDSGLGSSFGSSTLVSTPSDAQYTVTKDHAGTFQSLQGMGSSIEPIHNLFQDDSSPYVAGGIGDRRRELENRTEALTSIVDLNSFVCDQCGKTWKDKPSLSHHKITHDEDKTHKHKCAQCRLGFRYPKDMRRHVSTVHGVRTYLCNDCNKVYKRRDHLDRHLKTRGHIALSETASTPNTDWQDVPFSTGSDSHQYGHDRIYQPSREYLETPTPHRGLGVAHVHSNFQNTPLLPPYSGNPRPSHNPIASPSHGDNATASDIDSFNSEPL